MQRDGLRGPREFDLVLVDRSRGVSEARAALEACGSHDAALLQECIPVYAAWTCSPFLIAPPRRPELGQRLEERLRGLRAFGA